MKNTEKKTTTPQCQIAFPYLYTKNTPTPTPTQRTRILYILLPTYGIYFMIFLMIAMK